MMKVTLGAAILAGLAFFPALAAQQDPYAGGQKALAQDQYNKGREDLINQERVAGYAGACKVYRVDGEVGAVQTGLFLQFRNAEIQEGILIDNKLGNDVLIAFAEGQKAAASKGCDYFKQHPEVVRAIREQAQLLEEP